MCPDWLCGETATRSGGSAFQRAACALVPVMAGAFAAASLRNCAARPKVSQWCGPQAAPGRRGTASSPTPARVVEATHAAQRSGLNPREKFVPGEGLGHVVIGTKIEPCRLVNLGVLGGQHDHRHIRPLAQAPAYFGASWPWEHEAERHQISPVAVERRQRIGAGRADSDLEASLCSMQVRASLIDSSSSTTSTDVM